MTNVLLAIGTATNIWMFAVTNELSGPNVERFRETVAYTWETNRLGSNAIVERVCYKVLEFRWDGEPFRVEKRTIIERWIRTWKSGEGWKEER